MATREENIERFENLMATITRDGKDALMDYIKNKTDFYIAPASTQFHLSCAAVKWTLESACSTSKTDRLAPSMCSQPMKLPALSIQTLQKQERC